MPADPAFFETEADFRRWLEAHHASAAELLVGFWKKASGRPSIDWPQARDQALCFGWIDGIRHSLGKESYTIRFTPRRRGSVWSKVNIGRVEALRAAGQMTAAGERAFEAGREDRTIIPTNRKRARWSRRRNGCSARTGPPGRTGSEGRPAIARWSCTG